MSERCEGLVEYYDRKKGYGFITPFGQRDLVYVSSDHLESCHVLAEGQHVSFVLRLAQGRFEAHDVRP
ncbi:cold shock domain-containing protein [Streptomyces violascens]|uniref:cold shock domain-containing protein n=1 Tax=Streptomyces violascens TaxID=67381 RepID=UPI00367CCDD0